MAKTPDVRVGIVTYNTPTDLSVCLEHVGEAADGLEVELVVVDNGSASTRDRDVAARKSGAHVIVLPSNVGYPRAMNRALAKAQAPYLIALNPDTAPPPRSLTRLVERLEERESAGLVSPALRRPTGEFQPVAYRFPSPTIALVQGFVPPILRAGFLGRRYLLEGYAALQSETEVDWVVGAVHCVRREAVTRDRVYSERSFMYAEDLELSWYLRQNGWRTLYDPSVEVVHVGNTSGLGQPRWTREQKWLDATYAWYEDVHGTAAARWYATANGAGLSAKSVLLPWVKDPERRALVSRLRRYHWQRAWRASKG